MSRSIVARNGCAIYAAPPAGNFIATADTEDCAKMIERSLNAHDDLVSALRGMLDAFHEDPSERDTSAVIEATYAALAKAQP